MRRVIRFAAALSVALLAVVACMAMAARFRCSHPLRGFSSPVLAIEMARTMKEVTAVAGKPGCPDSLQMESQLGMDRLFIIVYLAEFLLMAYLLSRRTTFFGRAFRGRKVKVLAGLAASLSVAAAAFDFIENGAILRALRLSDASAGAAYDGAAEAIADAATVKWACLFVAMALLSLVFIGRRDGGVEKAVFFLPGGLFLATAAAGLAGLVAIRLNPDNGGALEIFQLPLAFGILSLVVALNWSAAKFEQGL